MSRKSRRASGLLLVTDWLFMICFRNEVGFASPTFWPERNARRPERGRQDGYGLTVRGTTLNAPLALARIDTLTALDATCIVVIVNVPLLEPGLITRLLTFGF